MGERLFGETIMKIHRIALAIAATILLAGCLPVTSKTPVGTTAGLGADAALAGTWIGRAKDQEDKSQKKDKGVLYLHFLKGKDAGTFSVLWVVTGGDKNDSESLSFTVSTAKLGAYHYLNAVQTAEDGKPVDDKLKDANIPLLYSFGRHHTLALYLLDEDKVKEAIKAGKIAGIIETRDFGDVKITADAAALDAFFATPEAAKLFKVFVVLRKAE
jgi:hypothetical protein